MKVILKSYKKTNDKRKLFEFGESLEQKGWKLNITEGGYLSPDASTMFIFCRSPYYGELLQQSQSKETEYNKCVSDFIASGEFIEY